jgi:hypothetical protein
VNSFSHGQLVPDWLSVLDRLVELVKEIDVEDSLQAAGKDLSPAVEAFSLVAVNPNQKVISN